MKAEEIKLALQKNSETHIQLNIVSILQNELGKGDTKVVSSRSSIKDMISGLNEAKSFYDNVVKQADKYLDMAKALGDAGIEKSLNTIKKNALDSIKSCDKQIKTLQSL
jgi:hypothetical protein